MVKNRIIEEASKLFAKSGVKSVTMGDLAKRLGISKRTIYENFADKEELLIACIDAYDKERGDFSQKVLAQTDNMVEAILMLLQIDSEKTYSLVEDVRKYFPQAYKEHLLRINNDRNSCFMQIINRGAADGVFRENIKTEFIVHFFNSWAKEFSHDNGFMLKEIFENIVITFIRGMCTAKGLEILETINLNIYHK